MVRPKPVVTRVVACALPVLALCGCASKDSSSPASSAASDSGSTATSPSHTGSGTTSSSSAGSTTSTTSAAASSSTGAGETVPVYWLGEANRRSVLYRDFVRPQGGENDVTASLIAMMSERPANSNWKSLWRSPKRLSVRQTDSAITVDLSSDAFTAKGVTAPQATASVQQLVWTATAAAQSTAPVTVLVDGKKGYRAWNTTVLGTPTKRAAVARAPIWVDTPAPGDTVNRGKVTVRGSANVVEGNVVVMVKDAAGSIVTRTAAQGGAGSFQPFRTTVQIPNPGTYTLTAYEPDESDGEGSGSPGTGAVTTKFTVR